MAGLRTSDEEAAAILAAARARLGLGRPPARTLASSARSGDAIPDSGEGEVKTVGQGVDGDAASKAPAPAARRVGGHRSGGVSDGDGGEQPESTAGGGSFSFDVGGGARDGSAVDEAASMLAALRRDAGRLTEENGRLRQRLRGSEQAEERLRAEHALAGLTTHPVCRQLRSSGLAEERLRAELDMARGRVAALESALRDAQAELRQQERRAHAEREQALRKLREVHEGDKEAGAASMEETRCQLLDRVAQLEEELAEERALAESRREAASSTAAAVAAAEEAGRSREAAMRAASKQKEDTLQRRVAELELLHQPPAVMQNTDLQEDCDAWRSSYNQLRQEKASSLRAVQDRAREEGRRAAGLAEEVARLRQELQRPEEPEATAVAEERLRAQGEALYKTFQREVERSSLKVGTMQDKLTACERRLSSAQGRYSRLLALLEAAEERASTEQAARREAEDSAEVLWVANQRLQSALDTLQRPPPKGWQGAQGAERCHRSAQLAEPTAPPSRSPRQRSVWRPGGGAGRCRAEPPCRVGCGGRCACRGRGRTRAGAANAMQPGSPGRPCRSTSPCLATARRAAARKCHRSSDGGGPAPQPACKAARCSSAGRVRHVDGGHARLQPPHSPAGELPPQPGWAHTMATVVPAGVVPPSAVVEQRADHGVLASLQQDYGELYQEYQALTRQMRLTGLSESSSTSTHGICAELGRVVRQLEAKAGQMATLKRLGIK
eukprot:jgi/Tetstr1/457976/TSEL_044489.t3